MGVQARVLRDFFRILNRPRLLVFYLMKFDFYILSAVFQEEFAVRLVQSDQIQSVLSPDSLKILPDLAIKLLNLVTDLVGRRRRSELPHGIIRFAPV